MNTWMVVVIAASVAILLIAVALLKWKTHRQQQGTQRLQSKFRDEYDRTVSKTGRKQGEAELEERQKRVESLDLRPLAVSEVERFTNLWTATQGRFVDEPGGAVSDADGLLSEVMQTRGYPVGDFEQRAADISVDHPQFVSNYRAAHAVAIKRSRGEASTEDLRQAMLHYRWLFTDLVESTPPGSARTGEEFVATR